MPNWILTTAYSAHMLATVVWIGGISTQALLLLPMATQRAAAPALVKLLAAVRSRFQPLAWLSLAVLVGSGLTQMSASSHYEGLLVIHNRWSLAILLKHLAIACMAALMAYQSWVLYPRWERLALIRSRSPESGTEADPALLKRENLLLRSQLLFSAVVLVLTAVARTS